MAQPFSLLPPRPRRKFRFALTPLADVMFQLLLFFMLSSSLTPYSLLTVQSGQGAATQAAPGADGENLELIAEAAIWSVSAGELTISGQTFDYRVLPDLAQALSENDVPSVVVIARPSAAVQDVATVLAALSAAGIIRITIVEARA